MYRTEFLRYRTLQDRDIIRCRLQVAVVVGDYSSSGLFQFLHGRFGLDILTFVILESFRTAKAIQWGVLAHVKQTGCQEMSTTFGGCWVPVQTLQPDTPVFGSVA
jgi:hypothetical protein